MEEQFNTFNISGLDAYIRNGYKILYSFNKQNVLYLVISNKKTQILCVIDMIMQSFEQLDIPISHHDIIVTIESCIQSQNIIISFQSGKVIFYHKQNDKYLCSPISFEEQIIKIIIDPEENDNIILISRRGKIYVTQANITKKKVVIDVQMSKPICKLNKPILSMDYFSFQVDQSMQQILAQIRQDKKQELINLCRIHQYQQPNRNIRCYILMLNFEEQVMIIQGLAMYLTDILSQIQHLINQNQHYVYNKLSSVNNNAFTQCSFIRNNDIVSGFSLIYTEKHIKYQCHINEVQESNEGWEEIDEIQINKNQAFALFGSKVEYVTHTTHVIQCSFPMDIAQLHSNQFNEDMDQLDITQQCKILTQHNAVFSSMLNAMCSKNTELIAKELNYQNNKPLSAQQITQIICILFNKHLVTINTQNPEMSQTHHIQNDFHPLTLCQFANSILMFGQNEIKQIFIEDQSYLFTLLQNEQYEQLIASISNVRLPPLIIHKLFQKLYQQDNTKAIQFLANSGLHFNQQCLHLITNLSGHNNILNTINLLIQYNYDILLFKKFSGSSMYDSLQILNMQFKQLLISINNAQLNQQNDEKYKYKQILNFNNVISTIMSIKNAAKPEIILAMLKQLLNIFISPRIIFPWIKSLLNCINQKEKINILNHLLNFNEDRELYQELLKIEIQNLQPETSIAKIPTNLQPNQYLDQLISNGVINYKNSDILIRKILIFQGVDAAFTVINKLLSKQKENKIFSIEYYQMIILKAQNEQIDLSVLLDDQINATEQHSKPKWLQLLLYKCNNRVDRVISLYQRLGLMYQAFQLSVLAQNYENAVDIFHKCELFKDKIVQIQLLIYLIKSNKYNLEQVLSIVYKDKNIFDFQFINALDKYQKLNIQWQKHVDFLKQQYFSTNNHIKKTVLQSEQCQIITKRDNYQIQLSFPLRCSHCKTQIKQCVFAYRCTHTLCQKCNDYLTNGSTLCPLCDVNNVLRLL